MEIINLVRTSMKEKMEQHINMELKMMMPIFYLFDGDINENIGESNKNRIIMRTLCKSDELFNIIDANLINIQHPTHSTLLYKFEHNENIYLYYSNTGLGINNHITDDDGNIMPILFLMNDMTFCNDILKNINDIFFLLMTISKQQLKMGRDYYEQFNALLPIDRDIFDSMADYLESKFNNITKTESKSYHMSMIYALLFYYSSLDSEKMKPCTFEHIISNKINKAFSDDYIFEGNFLDILTKCMENKYDNKFKTIYNNTYDSVLDSNGLQFKQFIEQFIEQLNLIPGNTFKHKMNNFNILYTGAGLFSSKQKSGSCTFYSYYNLSIHMLLLQAFNNSDVGYAVQQFKTFHYSIIYMLCHNYDRVEHLTFDDQYMTNDQHITNKKFTDSYVDNTFIFSLMDKYQISDEIASIYNEDYDRYFFSNNLLNNFKIKPLTTKILNTPIKFENVDNYFMDMMIFFKDTISNIKQRNDINHLDLMHNINNIFTEIHQKYKENFISQMILTSLDQYETEHKSYSIIYYYYLLILQHVYKNKNNVESQLIRETDMNKISLLMYYNSEKITGRDPNLFTVFELEKICLEFEDEHYCTKLKQYNHFKNMCTKDPLLRMLTFDEIIAISDFLHICTNLSDINEHLGLSTLTFDNISIGKYVMDEDIYTRHRHLNNKVPHSIFSDQYTIEHYVNYIYESQIVGKQNDDVDSLHKNVFKNNLFDSIYDTVIYKTAIEFNICVCPKTFLSDSEQFINEYIKSEFYREFNLISLMNKTTVYIGSYDTYDNINNAFENGQIKTSEELLNYCFSLDRFKWCERYGIVLADKNILTISYDLLYYLNKFGLNTNLDMIAFQDDGNYITVLVHNIKKIFKINIVDEIITDVIMFDDDNDPNIGVQLALNINEKTHPFLSFIPRWASYICYKNNDNLSWYLEFVVNSNYNMNFNKIEYLNRFTPKIINIKYDEDDNDNNDNNNYQFERNNKDYYNFKIRIAQSNFFPAVKTFDHKLFSKIIRFYHGKSIIIKDLNYSDKFTGNLTQCESILKELISVMTDTLSINQSCKQKLKTFSEHKDMHNIDRSTLTNFIDRNRFCTTNTCDIEKCQAKLLLIINKCNNSIESLLIQLNDSTSIENNLSILLNIMIHNLYIINSTQILNSVSSWDMGTCISNLYSIENFIDIINNNKVDFYLFEIIYLLQNDYIFKKDQIEKYIDIRTDLTSKDSNPLKHKRLKLHQFMMGKGKTSVFTPLLAFCIHFLTEKIPTIITMDHLKEDTKQFMKFTEHIAGIKTLVFSDYEAKKRWIMASDVTINSKIIEYKKLLQMFNDQNSMINDKIQEMIKAGMDMRYDQKISEILEPLISISRSLNVKLRSMDVDVQLEDTFNISDEMNIIDEFDSHHNYLQSIFNYIQNSEYVISKNQFTYIYYYVNGSYDDTFDTTENFRNHVAADYIGTNAMTYNKDYGFDFLVDDYANPFKRLSVPFARKDTPINNSNFSNKLLTLILTFRT